MFMIFLDPVVLLYGKIVILYYYLVIHQNSDGSTAAVPRQCHGSATAVPRQYSDNTYIRLLIQLFHEFDD